MKLRRFTPPSRAVRKASVDNLALVPASLLPFKETYQQLANGYPRGTTLIVLPRSPGKSGQTLGNVATQLAAKGYQIRVIPADTLGA